MLEPSETITSFHCTQCSHQTVWSFQRDHHIQRIHNNVHMAGSLEPYPCVHCDFKSHYKTSRYEHCLHQHTKSEDVKTTLVFEQFVGYRCAYCTYEGHSSLFFVEHDASCGMVRNETHHFHCDQCSYKSKYESWLKRHIFIHGPLEKITWFSCSKCPYRTKRKGSLTRHSNVCSRPAAVSLNCTECSYRAKYKRLLTQHMLTHAKSDEINWINCTQCSYRAKRKAALRLHLLMHAKPEDIEWWTCDKCSYRAKHKYRLKLHMSTHPTDDGESTWFYCAKCSYKSKHKRNLSSHVRKHVINTLRFCVKCSSYHDEQTYRDHKGTVQNDITQPPALDDDELKCTVCSYRAKQKRYMKQHMLTHAKSDEITWYDCTKCSYRTKYGRYIKQHMATHAADDEIEWFNCTECSYRGKQRNLLSKHMRIHDRTDAINWLNCAKCSFQTRLKSSLTRHVLTQHAAVDEINWFCCSKCSYRAKVKQDLKKHMYTHFVEQNID